MEFEKIKAPSLKSLFVEQLEHMIISGRLEIGTQLPSERELAETMQVSRAVVNAGIKEMAAKGFLEIRPRVGTLVGDYRRHGTIETLLSIMKYNGGRLQRDEVRSMLEIKLVLDRLAAQLAILRVTEAELGVLKAHLDLLQAAGDAEQAAQAAFGFYHELAIISGNTLLPLIYYSFRVPVLTLWERFGRKYGANSLYVRAGQLYDFIELRDVDGAVGCIEKTVGDAIRGSKEIYGE